MKLDSALVLGGIGFVAYSIFSEKKASAGTSAFSAFNVQNETPHNVSGRDFAISLPNRPGPERESKILGAFLSGDAMVRWSLVSAQGGGHEIVLPVMARALAIGSPGDIWRVICTYPTAQKIADEMSCHMLTSKVADLIFQQADVKLTPMNRPRWVTDGTMGLTSRSIEQSHALDDLVPADNAGLVANEGKHWVISGRNFKPLGFDPDKWAAPAGVVGSKHNGPNYGWHQANGKPLQSVGLAHDFGHTDYSQMVVLMSKRCTVDGEDALTADVLRDPVLSALISSEGPLPQAIHPDLG